jgi:DNA-binding NtrC family response regulator
MILVLHEHSLVRSMFSSLVEWMGYEVKRAHNIESARAVFAEVEQVLIVVCGCHLPDGEARDFMKQLRAEGNDTPFLVVSGRRPQDRCVAEMGFEFLPLPLRKEIFDEAVYRLVVTSELRKPRAIRLF